MRSMDFIKARRLVHKYNIKIPDSDIAKNRKQAMEKSEKIGFPVVLKIISPKILHKTEAGCVKINLKNEKEVSQAFEEINKNARKIGGIKGFLVQKMAFGREVIIGGKQDPQFGPIILFGVGGIFVEVLKDVSIRIAPVNKNQALEMIHEIKGYPILSGARGEKPVNLKKLCETIASVSRMLAEHKEIKEMDLNPVFVNEKECVAADVRILVD